MRSNNIIQLKTFDFSVRIIKLAKFLRDDKKESILVNQLLRYGTSIGANIEEAIGASSKKDFINKTTIAYKESRETIYWLKLLLHSEIISKKEFESIYNDAEEVIKIITTILKTSKTS